MLVAPQALVFSELVQKIALVLVCSLYLDKSDLIPLGGVREQASVGSELVLVELGIYYRVVVWLEHSRIKKSPQGGTMWTVRVFGVFDYVLMVPIVVFE
jgi:hypothetical protein